MTPEETPRVECEFDRAARRWKTRWFNCDDDEAARTRAAEHRIEQIDRQLSARHGLTNREKRELARERNFLQRNFTQQEAPPSRLDDLRKLKAAEKKLRWLARNADAKK
jgi:hypothetical protein